MKTFSERCYHESTRNAIFLLQSRQLNLITEPYGWEWSDDSLVMIQEDADYATEEEIAIFTRFHENKKLAYEDCIDIEIPSMSVLELWQRLQDYDGHEVFASWYTESVWLSRDEATDWAKRHEYRFHDGWRVYCVCAGGELATLIKET